MFQILWQNPAALFALGVIAAPILIHFLVQRRAEVFDFPTLRFLRPTRLAALRRHGLDDAALLAVRAAILAAAVAALAGPLIVTPLRREAWDRRVVRAVVADLEAERGQPAQTEPAADQHQSREFRTGSLRDGIRSAVAWLESAPPGRRELLVRSRFPIGSIDAADIAAVPAGIGIRLVRAGTLPAAQTVDAGRVVEGHAVLSRRVTLDGARTAVQETPAAERAVWPVEVVNAPAEQRAVDAAVGAVLAERVWAPANDRRARVVIAEKEQQAASGAQLGSDPATVRTPWMADGVARLVRDGDLQSAAARVEGGLTEAAFSSAPWLTIASARNGRPLAAAAESSGRLLLVSAAPAADLFTPLLLRSLANALAAPPDLRGAEVIPIPDRWLGEWSRPAGPVAEPRAESLRREDADDDRRWLWLAALALLAVEAWIRHARTAPDERQEPARVA
jgi:hypothetical protein